MKPMHTSLRVSRGVMNALGLTTGFEGSGECSMKEWLSGSMEEEGWKKDAKTT